MRRPAQAITSAKTSRNQIPAVYSKIPKLLGWPYFWGHTAEVLDYGGGAYDTFTDKLASHRVRNYVYDPFNRSPEHNALVERLLRVKKAEVAVCANVLNVIREREARQKVLEHIKELTIADAMVFIDVYEGDKTSRGKVTSNGWQAHRPLKNYLREVRRTFPDAWCKGGLIVAGLPR